MSKQAWKNQEKIFHKALELSGQEREVFLQKACSGDEVRLSEVRSLLTAFENDAGFLENQNFEDHLALLHEFRTDAVENSEIGSYRIRSRIGEGGMGKVYDATDARLNRRVALKFLSESLDDDNLARRRLLREAQAAAMLDHPNICSIYGIEQVGEKHFIVMQYVDGFTLADLIKKAPVDPKIVPGIFRQIVSAVAFAHSHGIIHRDLKPANIMIRDDSQIKVLDFGLAKTVRPPGDGNHSSRMSHNGLIIGTVSYMSPEQLRGERLDFQTDIFSIGIILYELITGKNPFARNSQAETIASVLGEQPAPLKDLDAGVSEDLLAIVRKCLEKDKSKRFQSAAEILVELDKTESGNYRQVVSKRRRSLLVKTAIAVSVLIAVLVSAYFYNARGSQKTLAILPISFENPPADKEYLAYGLTQSLIDKLSNLSYLNVKNESITARYRGKAIEPREAGKELNVDAVLTGIIKNRAGELVLETRLIRTSDGEQIDSNKEMIDETKLIGLLENIASRIINKIQTKLTDEDRNKLRQRDTESEAAKNLYFEGRFYLKTRKTSDYADKAVQAFSNAKDLDLRYAKAWAGLAEAYLSKSGPGVKDAIKPQLAAESAKIAANRALELDNTLCEAYNSLGFISLKYDWNWSEAERNFRTAINCDADLLSAYIGLINVLMFHEQFDEALAEAGKIKKIDPFSVSSDNQVAQIYYRKRDYAQVDKVLSELLPRFPDDTRLRNIRVYHFLITGRYKEAVEILEPVYKSEREEDKIFAAAPLGFAYAKMGRPDEALKIIEALGKLKNYVPAQERSLIYVGLGDYDKAFENLNKSCDERFGSLPGWVGDPIVDEVKSDPRFAEIKKCVNL
jgi:serine/threonine protein kinase/cytochrome c-type biogenesis protein CcmH/NrfG